MSLSAPQTKRLVALHGWLATVLSALLYAVILTGTVAVFAVEIEHWSTGETATQSVFDKPLDRHYRRLAEQVPEELHQTLTIYEAGTNTLGLFFSTIQDHPERGREQFGRHFEINAANGQMLSASAGYREDLFAQRREASLSHFLVELHARLHIPGRLGLYLTGALGIAMLVAAISGVLIHRNLIRDLFVTERPGNRVVSIRDRHNLAGVWSLPFAVLLAFTGAFLSFAISLGLPVVAMVAFGGDTSAALRAVSGTPPPAVTAAAPLTDLDSLVIRANHIAGVDLTSIDIQNAGQDNARIITQHDQPAGALRRVSLKFDGATGAFLGQSHLVGATPSAGNTLAELMLPLHFGDFSGKLSRVVWAALGAAMCFTIVTGFQLWLKRRETSGWQMFGTALSTIVWGLPLAMLGSAYGYFWGRLWSDPETQMQTGFLSVTYMVIAYGVVRWDAQKEHLKAAYQLAVAVLLMALPVFRIQTGGLSWGVALRDGGFDVLFMDTLCLATGVTLLAFRNLAKTNRLRSSRVDQTEKPT